MRNIWIQLINLLQISLPPSPEDSSPFGACLSIINHSLQHSPSVNLPQLLVDNGVECCCLCEECSRYQTFQYSLQEEGEILRTHFRQIVGKNQELLTDVPTNVN